LAAAQECQAAAWKFIITNSIDLSHIIATKFAEEMLPHPAAFGAAALGAAGADGEGTAAAMYYPPVVRALTYNLFIRAPAPQFTHNTDNDRKDERLRRFVEHLERYEIICLQEVFGAFSKRRSWLITVAARLGFQASHYSSTNVWPRFLFDGGLLILSRLPMVKKSSVVFEPGTHLDRLSAKGALHVKLQCGPAGPYLHVCTTHLQSTYSEESATQSCSTRHRQLAQLIEFLREATSDGASEKGPRRHWPMLLCGTLNFNGRQGPMQGSHSAEYCSVIDTLRRELGEVRDLLYDVLGSHPVTYADTRFVSSGEVPAERVLTNSNVYSSDSLKRQCLDYMFFFPPQPDTSASDSSGQRSPDPLVPATCQVEKFQVDRAKDIGAPITQLSDHYGVEATLAVIATSSPAEQVQTQRPFRATDAADSEPHFVALGLTSKEEVGLHCGAASAAAVGADVESPGSPGDGVESPRCSQGAAPGSASADTTAMAQPEQHASEEAELLLSGPSVAEAELDQTSAAQNHLAALSLAAQELLRGEPCCGTAKAGREEPWSTPPLGACHLCGAEADDAGLMAEGGREPAGQEAIGLQAKPG